MPRRLGLDHDHVTCNKTPLANALCFMSEIPGIFSPENSENAILVVATGGTSGLGFQALLDFVKQSEENVILVLGCRTPTNPSVSEAFSGIPKINKLDIVALDLVDLNSTRAFAAHVLQSYPQQISVLLLCAAAIYSRHSVDQSGNEKTLQTNVLSQALLLQCLWPRLTNLELSDGVSPRIVFVASSLHKGAAQEHKVSPSNIEDLLAAAPWRPKQAYALSKLVQMHLFRVAIDAFDKLDGGSAVPVVVAVSPGFVPQTGLVREYPWWARYLMIYVIPMMPFTTSLEKAGAIIMQAMKDQNLKSGDCISPRGRDSLAPESMDLVLRSAWRDWLITKGVWAEGM
ncbi:hypothetical protein FRC08_001349 [Ceratobasidium sp. 394]|nr:hypothetical protein FRC08_001349 [Ceratobasidium sp. 394]KAG9101987.1 hypothetical protein FS749_000552 [Ceratobasidium sp. UAMH 11750]